MSSPLPFLAIVAAILILAWWITDGGRMIASSQEPPRPTVFPFVMMHRGDGGCGGRAFLMAIKPEFGRLSQSRDCAHLDRSPITAMSRPVCDSCGGFVHLISANVIPLEDVPDCATGASL